MFVCPVCAESFDAGGFCTEDGTVLVDARSDPLLGQTVGSYRLAKVLGRGGMGVVYLGVHPGIGSRVAVKVLSPAASSDPSLVERFFSEARSVNVIRHESIVNVLDLSLLPDGRPCITMEYLDGVPLTRHLNHTRPFPLGNLAHIGLEVLGALTAAHALGITHRDLKPDNIFITSLGRVKVLDFGIAKLRPEQGGGHDGTRTGALLGTPQYMSPEQALGQPVDPRSDIYSLGAILFEGATGQRLFDGASLFELLRQHIEQAPVPPRSLRPDLPPSFEGLILRMLAKDRAQRFQTASECADALSTVMRELPEARGMSLPPPTRIPTTPPTDPSPGVVPATVAATAVTVGAPSAPQKSSSLGIILGGVGLLVALGAVAIAGVALVFGTSLVRSGTASSQATQTPSVPTSDDTSESSGSSTSGKGGKKVDPVAKLVEARVEAKKKLPDAELVGISVSGIERDGKLNLGSQTHAVAYTFRSPAESAPNKKCLVSVSISQWGMFTSTVADTAYDCKQPTVVAPSCSMAKVMQGVAKDKKITSLTFQCASGAWQWVMMFDGGGLEIKPDNC